MTLWAQEKLGVAAQLRSAAERQSTPAKIAPPGFLGIPIEPPKSQLLTIMTPATMPVLRVTKKRADARNEH